MGTYSIVVGLLLSNRAYPTSVQSEVTSSLAAKTDFKAGPLPLARDDEAHLQRGFCVRDRHLLTARWPGDAHLFAQELLRMLDE
ncbi:MAG: hypothetical protein GY822_28215 [Deltaproteobacteria bacterium]|nr:hypothetical protein [Deltaproteobacteria bacterium]